MANMNIKVDDRELKQFSKDLKIKRKSQIVAIERTVLNDQAFAVRTEAINRTLPGTFNIRSKWIASSILVDKAQGKNTKKIQSEVGAKKRWRRNTGKAFLGMLYQEKGKTITDPGIETAYSRSGNTFSGRVKPSMRFDRLGNIVDESQYPGTGAGRIVAMLRILERQSYKGAFRIRKGTGNFRKGIYKFSGKQVKFGDGKKHKPIRQIMDTSKKSVRIPRKPWLSRAVKRAINKNTVGEMYRKAYQRFTKERIK